MDNTTYEILTNLAATEAAKDLLKEIVDWARRFQSLLDDDTNRYIRHKCLGS